MMHQQDIELSGSDYFLCAMDRIMRNGAGPDSQCRMVVELDGRLDPENFRKSVHCSSLLQWMVNIRKSNFFPFALPRWRNSGPGNKVSVSCHDGEGSCFRQNGGLISFSRHPDQGAAHLPLSFEFVNYDNNRSTCILNWEHTLMDAHGAEILMQHVARCPEGAENIETLLPLNGQNVGSRVPASFSFARRLSYARRSVHYISEASAMPIAVLKSSANNHATADQYFTIHFSEEETREIVSQCESMGLGYCHSLFYLAAATRAVHGVRMRNMDEALPYLVPVPLNLRRKGGSGAAFSNNVSFLFYRITPDEIADFKAIVVSLKNQMKTQVMEEIPHSYAEMMKILRRLPLPLYSRLLSGPTRGQFASFFFSYTGECCSGMDSFMGQPVREVTHLAPATTIPGLSVVFMRHCNCLKMILSFRDSLLNEADLEMFAELLRMDLLPGKS